MTPDAATPAAELLLQLATAGLLAVGSYFLRDLHRQLREMQRKQAEMAEKVAAHDEAIDFLKERGS